MKNIKKVLLVALVMCFALTLFACNANNSQNGDGKNFCTLKVDCSTILNNKENISEDKLSLVGDDGIIYYSESVGFTEGETSLDILKRVLQAEKIHLEYESQGSYYIEGINNIYTLDCGELSGWMYAVNGEYSDVDCGSYKVKNGDKIEFNFTCDMGADLGISWE